MRIKEKHADYVFNLWCDMRTAVRTYRKFDQQWNEMNDALDAKLDADGQRDPIMRDRTKSDNLKLAGYLNAAAWWREKAEMIAAVIQAEKAAAEMLNGDGAAWDPPTTQPSSWALPRVPSQPSS